MNPNWPLDYLLSTDSRIGMIHHVDGIDDEIHSKLTFEELFHSIKERFTFEGAVERGKSRGCSPVLYCLKCFPWYNGKIIWTP